VKRTYNLRTEDSTTLCYAVAFVGAVSNVPSLCNTYKWLAWICKLPEAITGAISGFLPPVSLAILMLLLPIILRLLAQFEGIPSRTGVELALMHRFFSFQGHFCCRYVILDQITDFVFEHVVIHSFLIVTLSSGIIAALPDLVKDPTNIPNLLAQRLPLASNFFLTYIILQGLSGTASGFLQAVQLILYYVKIVIMGSTPRSVYDIKFGPRTVNWGTLFPTTTLLVVIGEY
jgi:calcium permeable stress-gated cation channel